MKTLYFSIPAILMTTTSAFAQGLSKEIVVDKEIILEQRDVTPLSVQPKLVVGQLDNVTLAWSSTSVESTPTTEIATLPPAAWRSAITESPYRGYLRAGYFPLLQGDVAAGYKAISRQNMRLNLWGQYTGMSYKNRASSLRDRLTNNDANVGASYRWMPVDNSLLSADATFQWGGYTMPRYIWSSTSELYSDGFRQRVTDLSARLGWQQDLKTVNYGANLNFGRFSFARNAYYGAGTAVEGGYKALSQTKIDAAAWVVGRIIDGIDGRVRLTYDGVYNPAGMYLDNVEATPKTNYGVFAVAPAVVAKGDTYRVKVGLVARVRTGEVSKFTIFPDVRIDWLPTQQFSIYAAVAGGSVNLNSLSGLYYRTRYINSSKLLTPATEKLAVEGGISIGPISGFSIDLKVAGANWSGVVMPTGGYLWTLGNFVSTHIKSLTGGATLRYQYANLLKLRAGYQFAAHGRYSGNVDWLDRAEGVLDTRLDVTPLKALTVSGGYNMRVKRHAYDELGKRLSLSPARDLFLGASYIISDQWSVEATAHNLTNARWQEAWGIGNPGITGFIGFTYKF